jgi:glutaredoxin 3
MSKKPERVRLFVKPFCGWCHEAVAWLEQRGVVFEKLDVTSDRSAYREMVELTGQSKAPCIEVDGEVLADFGVDELDVFWRDVEA